MNLSKKERKCSKKVPKLTVDCGNCKKVLKFTADCGFSKKVLKFTVDCGNYVKSAEKF